MDQSTTTGTLRGIAVRSQPGAPMIEMDQVSVSKHAGLAGDGRENSRRRQVTVLSQESWMAASEEVEESLPWTTRRANLLLEGISLKDSAGKFLQIGSLLLEITGETRPCHIMESACVGLQEALSPDWRGGVTCRVIKPAEIRVGDRVTLKLNVEESG